MLKAPVCSDVIELISYWENFSAAKIFRDIPEVTII